LLLSFQAPVELDYPSSNSSRVLGFEGMMGEGAFGIIIEDAIGIII
jgi:hypothetical protein